MKYQTFSEKQTMDLGKKLAQTLQGGEVILLAGELGAGKTVLVKGLAVGLGIKQIVTSPTFVLFKIYPVKNRQPDSQTVRKLASLKLRRSGSERQRDGKQIKYLVHVDAYRVADGRELLAAGLGDYLGQPDTVTAIEWGEKAAELVQERVMLIKLKTRREGRVIEVD